MFVVVVVVMVVVVKLGDVVSPNGGCVTIFVTLEVLLVLVAGVVVNTGLTKVQSRPLILKSKTIFGYTALTNWAKVELHAIGLSTKVTWRKAFKLSKASTSKNVIRLLFTLSICKPIKLKNEVSVMSVNSLLFKLSSVNTFKLIKEPWFIIFDWLKSKFKYCKLVKPLNMPESIELKLLFIKVRVGKLTKFWS